MNRHSHKSPLSFAEITCLIVLTMLTLSMANKLQVDKFLSLAQPKYEHVTKKPNMEKQLPDDFQMSPNSLGKTLLKGR